jgi:hypothetical protein
MRSCEVSVALHHLALLGHGCGYGVYARMKDAWCAFSNVLGCDARVRLAAGSPTSRAASKGEGRMLPFFSSFFQSSAFASRLRMFLSSLTVKNVIEA